MNVYKDFLLEKNSTYQFLIENNKLNIKTDSAYYYDLNKYFNYYQYGLNSLPFFGKVDNEKIVENTQDHLLIPGAVNEETVIVDCTYTGITKLKFISPQYFNEQYEEINGMVINNSPYTEIGKSNYFSFDNTEDNPVELYYTKYTYKKDSLQIWGEKYCFPLFPGENEHNPQLSPVLLLLKWKDSILD